MKLTRILGGVVILTCCALAILSAWRPSADHVAWWIIGGGWVLGALLDGATALANGLKLVADPLVKIISAWRGKAAP